MSKTCDTHMSVEERETLSLGLAHGHSLGTDARSAVHGFTNKLRHVPALLRNTLTDDRGTERAAHECLSKGTALSGYTQRKLNTLAHRLNT